MIKPARPSVACGFTLIELLVVISIISLLVAILLPALSKARAAAYTTQCRVNMRSVMLATAVYANDHRGDLPGSRFNNARDYTVNVSHSSMVTPSGSVSNVPVGAGRLVMKDYLSSPRIAYCPGRPEGDRLTYSGPFSLSWTKTNFGGDRESPVLMATGHSSVNDNLDYRKWHNFNSTRGDKFFSIEYCFQSTAPPTYTSWARYGYDKTGHGPSYNMALFDGSARALPDPANYLQITYQGTSLNPWHYAGTHSPYYIQTAMLGWTDARWRQNTPRP
jgi:prepilin-type N-terminal cleavage/methylation domain-containing protein